MSLSRRDSCRSSSISRISVASPRAPPPSPRSWHHGRKIVRSEGDAPLRTTWQDGMSGHGQDAIWKTGGPRAPVGQTPSPAPLPICSPALHWYSRERLTDMRFLLRRWRERIGPRRPRYHRALPGPLGPAYRCVGGRTVLPAVRLGNHEASPQSRRSGSGLYGGARESPSSHRAQALQAPCRCH